ncbi:MAG: hypothetical protein ABL899_03360 [Nitrospira sp.]
MDFNIDRIKPPQKTPEDLPKKGQDEGELKKKKPEIKKPEDAVEISDEARRKFEEDK